jgi:adenylate cyclase
MATEIERKFLVKGDQWRALASATLFRQGYLSIDKERTVRIRVAGERGYLTIKGRSSGISRAEFEYEIPLADAEQMLDTLCIKPLIEKRRHRIVYGRHVWEVDEFLGDNQGLIVAEIELGHETENFERPEWIGVEVSNDARYFNSNLSRHPYSTWQSEA